MTNVTLHERFSTISPDLILGSSMGMGMAPELDPDVMRGLEKFQMTNFTMPNKTYSIKCALKSVPVLADVGVPHGDGDGPVTSASGSRSKMCTYHVVQQGKLKGLGRSKAT